MNVWPATLPQFVERSNYQEGTGDGRLRSQTETGPAKVRRRFSAIPRPLTVQIRMTGTQLAAFETFVHDALSEGVLPFQFPAIRGAGTWIVQMAQNMPQWTALGGDRWMVQLDLVILP